MRFVQCLTLALVLVILALVTSSDIAQYLTLFAATIWLIAAIILGAKDMFE